MSFKSKMKKKGNEIISQYSSNPYLIRKETKRTIPLWGKILLPSSLITTGVVVAVVLANSFGSRPYDASTRKLNNPIKVFNAEHSSLDPKYIQSVKDFAADYYLASQQYNYDGYDINSRDERKGNLIFSPLSLTNELFMLYDATDGEAKEEIGKVIHYSREYNHLEEIQKMILNTSIDKNDSNNECFSEISNSVFIIPAIAEYLRKEYVNILSEYYFADLYQVDFNSDESRRLIADYINEKTNNFFSISPVLTDPNHGQIGDSAYVDDITFDESNFKIFDLTYLKASWPSDVVFCSGDYIFNNHDGTRTESLDRISYVLDGEVMEGSDYYIVKTYLQSYSLNILLPKEGVSYFDSLSKNIHNLLNFQCESKYSAHIHFCMPTFKNCSGQDISFVLKSLGIQQLFDKTGALGAIFDKRDYRANIGTIEHYAGINVNQNGIEAASFTQNHEIVETSSADIPTIFFNVNRPFLYSITNVDDLPMYLGQIYKM